jgi:WD40 repeat protein
VFYVDLSDARHQLTHSCLGLMLDDLKFNICKLDSSYLANSDVPDLESRIATYIPSALPYACIYWGDHLNRLAFDHDVLKKLRLLFETKFLFWLEVLSVKKGVGLASRALSSLLVWLLREVCTPHNSIWHVVTCAIAFTNESEEFVGIGERCIFICAVIRNGGGKKCTTYLPLCPAFRASLFPDPEPITSPISSDIDIGTRAVVALACIGMTIEAHDNWVLCVAFSPDGERIASASEDRTIRVWDATTGQIVADPLTGHTDSVTSVAFSPDGQRIASASEHRTIRVWDATTGQIVAGPFTGHSHSVTSVAYSPDGEYIASASDDRTIRVWDATTGEIVAGPFTGHTHSVTSAAYSPEGQHTASASDDGTIHVMKTAINLRINPWSIVTVGYTEKRTNLCFGFPSYIGRTFIDPALSGLQENMRHGLTSQSLHMDQIGPGLLVHYHNLSK